MKLELAPGRLSEYGVRRVALPPIAGGAGTFSNYTETHMLDHLGKTSFASPATYLALCTVVPDSSKTGATIVEATYSGYQRATVAAGSWAAAVSGGAAAASTKNNSATITFADCVSSSSTVIGWALCDNVGTSAGNMLAWGTCTSVTITTTQTPATVAIGALVLTLI